MFSRIHVRVLGIHVRVSEKHVRIKTSLEKQTISKKFFIPYT